MNPQPDGSYVTTLQQTISKGKGKGKSYPEFSTYLPVEKMRSLGWKKGMKLRVTYATWKDKFGKHSGLIIEPHGWKCQGCGAFNSREAGYCTECGAARTSTGKSASSPVAGAAVASR